MISAQEYGPWAVISGGSEGVGAAFARELAKAGVNLVLIARREGPLAVTASETRELGVQVRTFTLDLAQPDILERIQAETADLKVGMLVSNVGTSYGKGMFVDLNLDDALTTIHVNPRVHTGLSHIFGKKMAQRGRGGIVLIGSLAGNAGGASMVMYSACKAFTQNFAEGLWAELQPKGVDVVYVVLGATDTPTRARQGFQDPPDLYIDDPNDVARDTLHNIKHGPVLVRPHLEQGFQFFQSAPRRQAAEAMRNLLTGFDASTKH